MNTLYVVACGTQQRPLRLPAAQLYVGPLFSAAITHARRFAKTEQDIRILSPKHGLLSQGRLIDPYNPPLSPLDAVSRVPLVNAIRAELPRKATLPLRVVMLASDEYATLFREACAGTRFEKVPLRMPLSHLDLPQQIHWLQAAQWPLECDANGLAADDLSPDENEQLKSALRVAALWWTGQLMIETPPPDPSLFTTALALELRRTWKEVASVSRGEWPEDIHFALTCQDAEGPIARAFQAIGLSPREWWKREWHARRLSASMHFSMARISVQSDGQESILLQS